MAYPYHPGVVYIVHWPQWDALKVGYTNYRRWRYWQLRGGEILHMEPATVADETAMHETMRRAFTRRWNSKAAMAEAIGSGGGWMETYLVPAPQIDDALGMLGALPGALPRAMHVRDVRTNVHTRRVTHLRR